MEKHNFKLVFSKTDEKFNTNDLGDFLLLFKAVYTAAVQNFSDLEYNEIIDNKTSIRKSLILYIRRLRYQEINRLFIEDLGKGNLVTIKAQKESPLEFIVYGVLSAITLAVIISGGRLKTGFFEAQLAPLGDGIKKLREALSPSKSTEIGYSIKTRQVKLSKNEYKELTKYKVEDAHKGGFQKFFASLILRTDPRTYEIELMGQEIERIINYGRQSGKGGFQSSLRKIFGRHFIK